MTTWILIDAYPNEALAEIAKTKLEAEGIPAQTRLSPVGGALLGGFGIQNGPTDVLVRESDAARAASALGIAA